MLNLNDILEAEIQGLFGNQLERINKINEWYAIYKGEQEWDTNRGLDYEPTKQVTNKIKKLIDKRARFMFSKRPFFDIRPTQLDEEGSETFKEQAQAKEDLLEQIFKDNKFYNKLIKARRDCSIGGKIAIKLWAHEEQGLKIVFAPAQEFLVQYNEDDVDKKEKVMFIYSLNEEEEKKDQRIKKQTWELNDYGICILNEATYDGEGNIVSEEFVDYSTELDFIPVVIIQNGGLLGETEGESDVELLWGNQDSYNKLKSDDLDALKFQMFGQDVITDADESSLEGITIAPGAIIDLQTNPSKADEGKQAKMQRLESGFSYKDKFSDTIDRVNNDMHDLIEVPNVSMEQLSGVISSGKSMQVLYWNLMDACNEDWIEWGTQLELMVEYIFKMVDTYNLYSAREIAKYNTSLNIEYYYPIQDDENEQKKIDMEEVRAELRSRESYIDKWHNVENIEMEIDRIIKEKLMLQDSYNLDLLNDIND